jgi:hypothetical protein
MARYVLVGCGSTKQDGCHAIRDLYSSNYFGLKRDWTDRFADVWWVLSGKFGLVAPDRVVRDYNVEVPGDVCLPEWQARVEEQARARIPLEEGDTLWVLAGKGYLDSTPDGTSPASAATLRDHLERLPVRLVTPFDHTSGIGKQQKWLGRCVREDRLVPPEEAPDDLAWPPEGNAPTAADGGPRQSRLSGF